LVSNITYLELKRDYFYAHEESGMVGRLVPKQIHLILNGIQFS